MNETINQLQKVRELLSDPTRWTKSAFAKKADGTTCSAVNPKAVCWCLVGATLKFNNNPFGPLGMIDALLDTAPTTNNLAVNNDSISHEQLLDWIDKAIEHAKTQA
jgi:hypothetical protein